ncbi:alpha beta-hydrolase [Lecanosticta acicola]|uniref:Alpha beta-hydrolase n=1 Tax=Lecanosticta acicola TaxID=111012 RepID=A0AAI8YRF4_9PEZI|nr:alpha beta-hydrolase [Lecanosticta acicola]
MSGHTRAKTVVTAVIPFTPGFSPSDISRLEKTLKETRPPREDVVPGAGNDYGMPTEWAQSLFSYWTNKYSLENAMSRIQQWPHFMTHIEEMSIHFVHQKSKHQNAIPLLCCHGWPGSFYEFSEVITPLAEGDGSGKGPVFDVVVPSLPGFCWSSAPQRRGWTMKDTARIFHKLMTRLGHDKYCVQAGDWGQFIARELGAKYADSCKVIHLNYCPGALPEGVELTERERKCAAKGQDWRTAHVGYAVLMRTRPQTLGWMLIDNPLGLMSFVGEKFEEAASPSVSSTAPWMDHVLTTVCLYYFTRCIMTSCLPYYENIRHDQFAEFAIRNENRIKCPFGYTSMWYDTAPNSKRAVERTGNLVWYRERDYAGHFACLEDPKGMCEDIREVVEKHFR